MCKRPAVRVPHDEAFRLLIIDQGGGKRRGEGMSDDSTVDKRERRRTPTNFATPAHSLFRVVVVIRALSAFAIVPVFRDRTQD